MPVISTLDHDIIVLCMSGLSDMTRTYIKELDPHAFQATNWPEPPPWWPNLTLIKRLVPRTNILNINRHAIQSYFGFASMLPKPYGAPHRSIYEEQTSSLFVCGKEAKYAFVLGRLECAKKPLAEIEYVL